MPLNKIVYNPEITGKALIECQQSPKTQNSAYRATHSILPIQGRTPKSHCRRKVFSTIFFPDFFSCYCFWFGLVLLCLNRLILHKYFRENNDNMSIP